MSSPACQKWLEHFTKTGQISPIALGMSRGQLRAFLGEPDDHAAYSTVDDASIWKYDELEFHFDGGADGTLNLIFMEVNEFVLISICPIARRQTPTGFNWSRGR